MKLSRSSSELTGVCLADENQRPHDLTSRQPTICKMSRKANVYHLLSSWPVIYWQRNVQGIFFFLKKESPYCRHRLKKDGFGRRAFIGGENPGPEREVVADAAGCIASVSKMNTC